MSCCGKSHVIARTAIMWVDFHVNRTTVEVSLFSRLLLLQCAKKKKKGCIRAATWMNCAIEALIRVTEQNLQLACYVFFSK